MAEDQKPPDNPDGQDQRPDWLVSNFNTAEDQARAYTSARSEMQEAQRRAADAERQVAEYEQYVESLQQTEPDPELQYQPGQGLSNPLVMQLEQARAMGDTQTELALMAYVAQQLDQQNKPEPEQNQPDPVQIEQHALWANQLAQEKYDTKYGQGAWEDDRLDASEFLNANPDLLPETLSAQQAADRLVVAAEYVRGQKMLTGQEEALNQQDARRRQRVLAQTSTQSGTPPPNVETDAERWARIQQQPAGNYAELRNT